jgi:hypothetical protein
VSTLTVAQPIPIEEVYDPSSEQREPASPSSPPSTKSLQTANLILLTLLFAAPALMCLHSAIIADPDIWWHLRTGEWILQHHAIPRVDTFSGVNAGKPWQAYSWLFEVLTFKLFHRFGLAGVIGFSTAMVLSITVAMRHLVARLQSDFSVVILLTFAACFSLGHLYTPRPWMFSILFFVLEIDILMQTRRTGRTRELLWLPVLFALWSNLHIQFIDGLLVLGLALGESIVSRWNLGQKTFLRPGAAAFALVASMAGTCANPYGWHIYGVAYGLASQAGVLNKISELQAIPFRDLSDFCLLFMALGATAVLARKRQAPLFELGLLLFASVVSFRSQRDIWVMVTVAATILATVPKGEHRVTVLLPRFAAWCATAAAALMLLACFRGFHVDQNALQAKVDKVMPTEAANFILANHLHGPLYNDFTWGGYLIWSLRMPVSLDGRAAFYGDKAIDRSIASWDGKPDWNTDPALTSAGVIIGPKEAALSQLLRIDPHYQIVYEDKVADVFIPRK